LEISANELVSLLDVERLRAVTSVETPSHCSSAVVATGGDGDDDIAVSTSVFGAVGIGRAGEVNLNVAGLVGGRGDTELIDIGILARGSVGHGNNNLDRGIVTLLLAGIDHVSFADLHFLSRAEDEAVRGLSFKQIASFSVGSPIKGGDGAAGGASIANLVALLDGDHVLSISTLLKIGGRDVVARDVSSLNLAGLLEFGDAAGVDADLCKLT
jgi:hypothetical protein